jgi:anti-sigma regulatory factor (Ser/Thr protein kinase)
LSIQTTERGEAASTRQARFFVSSWAQTWGHHRLIASAALLTSELATNAIKDSRGVFEVDVAETDHGIRVGVTDSSTELPVVRRSQEVQADGRGLLLVEAIASSSGADPRAAGKRVWFELQSSGVNP